MMTNYTVEEIKSHEILAKANIDFSKALNIHAFLKVGNRAIGEDLVQQTFAKTWSYLVKGGNVDLMRAFLYHVLNGLIIDEYRKRKTLSLDALLSKGFEPHVDDRERLINKMDGKMAMLMIESLPEPYKRVMRLRYKQDMTLPEISLLTGRTKGTVTVQIHRGLAKLKVLYKTEVVTLVV
jgi:RNA polymerase sigma-70 factor, ECF subfamily